MDGTDQRQEGEREPRLVYTGTFHNGKMAGTWKSSSEGEAGSFLLSHGSLWSEGSPSQVM